MKKAFPFIVFGVAVLVFLSFVLTGGVKSPLPQDAPKEQIVLPSLVPQPAEGVQVSITPVPEALPSTEVGPPEPKPEPTAPVPVEVAELPRIIKDGPPPEPAKEIPEQAAVEPEVKEIPLEVVANLRISQKSREEYLKKLPAAAKTTLPLLEQVADKYWPTHPDYSLLAAQVTKETCKTLSHSLCLTSRAQLKTSREWGTGYGQLTIAYNKDGSERFNTIKEVKSFLPELASWNHSQDPYNSYFHMVGFIGKMQRLHSNMNLFDTPLENYKGTLVSYNRGYGGLLADRNVCKRTPGCNPNKWTGNVEHTSNIRRLQSLGMARRSLR